MFLLLIMIDLALGSQPQITPDLFLNRLNMSFGIDLKYNGLLHHNIDRVWVVTKVALPNFQIIFLSLTLPLTQILHLSVSSSIRGQLPNK